MDRRSFLHLGLGVATAGVVVPVRGTLASDDNSPFPVYGKPANEQQSVARWPSTNPMAHGNGVAWCPLHQLEGSITPNGLHFIRNHNGVPRLNDEHKLVVHGKVHKALSFKARDLLQYPQRSIKCFIECGGNSNAGWHSLPSQGAAGFVHGLASCAEWTGVPVSALLDESGIKDKPQWLIVEGADDFAMQQSLPLREIYDTAIVALYQNGERLRAENGYPMRLLWPGHEGVTNVKWLQRMELSDRPVMARNETARYTDLKSDGRADIFSWRIGVKSIMLSPSAGMSLPEKGLVQLSGLAWSGNGKIARVEVSVDGGNNWQQASLDHQPEAHSFTRFRHYWQWKGERALLQSRATDETGQVQPQRDKLVAERGRQGYYHYNAITTWQVDTDGEVSHVYHPNSNADSGSSGDAIDADWF